VLKANDPKALEVIDAVFVTVEPHGGSQPPSGEQLLFASLRISSNYPSGFRANRCSFATFELREDGEVVKSGCTSTAARSRAV